MDPVYKLNIKPHALVYGADGALFFSSSSFPLSERRGNSDHGLQQVFKADNGMSIPALNSSMNEGSLAETSCEGPALYPADFIDPILGDG